MTHRRPIVTLLTDFGIADAYVGIMKGAVLSRCPSAALVDLTHDVPPQDLPAAAVVLAQALPWFPPGTVHAAVVDPGVGTDRDILVVELAGQLVVAPDNGLITLAADAHCPSAIYAVRDPALLPGDRSATFHGRDVFAPVAGMLASGLEPPAVGPSVSNVRRLELPEPVLDAGTIEASVIYIDRFGNAFTNLSRGALDRWRAGRGVTVSAGRPRVEVGVHATYADVPPGEPLALINSVDRLEIAVNQGSAAGALGLSVGSAVLVRASAGITWQGA